MKLNIKDRLSILGLLPPMGDMVTLLLRQDIKNKVELSQEEVEKYGVKVEEKKIHWDESKAEEKEVDFTDAEKQLLSKELKQKDDKKELTIDLMDLYKKFVGIKESSDSKEKTK